MQTVVNHRMKVACPGLIAEPFGSEDIRSCAAEGGNIPFGRGVVQGTQWNQAKLPTADTQKFIGVAAHSNAMESTAGNGEAGYREKNAMNVMNFGSIWMPYTGTAPTINAPIYIVASGANAGKAIAAGTGAITAPLIARYVDTATGLVLVAMTQRV